jgi:DNA repair protein RadC
MNSTTQSLFGSQEYKPTTKLQQMSLREQPAYRVASNPTACTSLEVLAAVIGGARQIETAENLMTRFKGDIRNLYRAPVEEIADVRGIGQQTAARIKAAFALSLKMHMPVEERISINSPADAAELVRYEMSLLEQEYLKVILLNVRNHVIDIVEVYHGSVNSAQVRIGEVFKPAIQRMASGIIAVHNHPSTDPTPSPDDVAVTRAMVQAGKLVDVQLLDHLIIGGNNFVSLKERGLGFS